MVTGNNTQDTIKPALVIRINIEKLLSDSVFLRLERRQDSDLVAASGRSRKKVMPERDENEISIDYTDVCVRNTIADVTFYDPDNLISELKSTDFRSYPFLFIGKKENRDHGAKTLHINNLKEGEMLPGKPFQGDWIIIILLITSFLFSLLRTSLRSILPHTNRFFLLRGINDPASRDINALFHWRSTLLNLISFISLGLFAFCASAWYDFIPEGISGFLFWLISFAFFIIIVTLRHLVCTVTGNISQESEAFDEYLVGVYHSYRISAFVLLGLVILLVYTVILPPGIFFTSGLIVLMIMYLLRVSRLFLIFLRRDISIFYLILYLCVLEVLPVLISLKYFTGLI